MLSFWFVLFFFFKQKTAYEMRISDWSSDVCSSDLHFPIARHRGRDDGQAAHRRLDHGDGKTLPQRAVHEQVRLPHQRVDAAACAQQFDGFASGLHLKPAEFRSPARYADAGGARSEEHTSELQSLMRISYAVCF